MMTLTSGAFAHGGAIPAHYTCDGKDCSPALAWTGVPAGAKSLVLVADRPEEAERRARPAFEEGLAAQEKAHLHVVAPAALEGLFAVPC